MRRQLLFIAVLLCALTLGGWGSVAAIALCPHAAQASSVDAAATPAEAMEMDGDHACCPAKDGVAAEHCAGSAGEAKSETEAVAQTNDAMRSLAQLAASCLHCFSHNSLPPAPVSMREAERSSSEASRAASQEVKPLAPPAVRFLSAIIPVQGAPPYPPHRKHLLLSVFLI
ncbi:MAG TPA: hypothetical protein VF735_17135 [Pyrinomonadaceae bacterium]